MLQMAEKREHQSPVKDDVLHKCKPGEELCAEKNGTDGLREVTMLQVDQCSKMC